MAAAVTTGSGTSGTVSDTVAAKIRDIRKRRGWNVADLATRCEKIAGGAERLTASVIENIEHGRRRDGQRTRDVTVDELVAISRALSVPTSALMPEFEDGTPVWPVSRVPSHMKCRRQDFDGIAPAGTCPDCGHMIMAHVGAEQCVVCRMEWLLSPEGRRFEARIRGNPRIT